MKRRLLTYIVCPKCSGELVCAAESQQGEDIITGQLTCEQCGKTYPIVRGIPRMLLESPSEVKKRTADNFGWEWQHFKALAQDLNTTQAQFLDWVWPLTADYFRGKIVVDAGCGMGRWPMVVSQFGAQEVLAFDLSNSVEAACDNLAAYPNVHILQADIYNLPFRCGPQAQIDCIYSIGVLHHLPDPAGGFQALTQFLRPGGGIFGWVYGLENNEWIVKYINPLRHHITSRLPAAVLYWLCFLLTLTLHPILKLLYKKSASHNWRRRLPYYSYLSWLEQFAFAHTHHVIHDHLTAPLAEYIPHDEYQRWFTDAGLVHVWLHERNANSWRGYGEKPVIIAPVHQ